MATSGRTHSLAEASTLLGVHRNTLAKWLNDGCPAVTRADRDRGIEWELSIPDIVDWRIRKAVEDAVSAYEDGSGLISLDEAKRRKAVADAIMAEKEAEEATRSVVRVADVVETVTGEYGALRSHLGNLGAKVAGRAAAMTNPAEIHELVDEEIRLSLEVLQLDLKLADKDV